MTRYENSFAGRKVLDAGCGEGKNAVFLARLGADVDAVDVSIVAIENGRRMWKREAKVRWIVADIRYLKLPQKYDIAVARTAYSTALMTELRCWLPFQLSKRQPCVADTISYVCSTIAINSSTKHIRVFIHAC